MSISMVFYYKLLVAIWSSKNEIQHNLEKGFDSFFSPKQTLAELKLEGGVKLPSAFTKSKNNGVNRNLGFVVD